MLAPAPAPPAGPAMNATPAERGASIARNFRAIAWRSGMIEIIDRNTPPGAIKLFTFTSRRAALVGGRVLETRARHAYDGETVLVPGVPEEDDDDAAIAALISWCRWVQPALKHSLPRRAFFSEVQ